MDWVDRPQNFKGLYGILQVLQGSQFSAENSQNRLGSFSFSNISVEMFRFSM